MLTYAAVSKVTFHCRRQCTPRSLLNLTAASFSSSPPNKDEEMKQYYQNVDIFGKPQKLAEIKYDQEELYSNRFLSALKVGLLGAVAFSAYSVSGSYQRFRQEQEPGPELKTGVIGRVETKPKEEEKEEEEEEEEEAKDDAEETEEAVEEESETVEEDKEKEVDEEEEETNAEATAEDSLISDEIKEYYAEDGELPPNFYAALEEIISVFGTEKLDLEYDQRKQREKDDWSYHMGKIPLVIAYPESTEEVSKLMQICSKYRLPVVPFGCGTSLEGHTVFTQRGVLCNLSRMDQIIEFHKEDADIVVQTGIQWMELNTQLENTGFFFPMDPGPGAAIGGMIGTCCSGTNAVKYGVMKDWILSITVVLPGGEIVKLGSRARKDVAGYDLTRLFVGAEGTLGVITEATLKLTPVPPHHLVAVCSFPTTHEACGAVGQVIRQGIQVSGAEYLDPLAIKIVNTQAGFDFPEQPTIMFKFSGTPGQLQEAETSARQICDSFHGGRFQYRSTYENGAEMERLWSARKDLLFNAISWSEGRESWITDVCVPIGALPDVLQNTIDDLAKSRLDAPVFGHVGDGNFHAAILFNPGSSEDTAEAKGLNERMITRAIDAQGTCTGEHGVGEGKKKYLKQQLTPEAMKLMVLLKKTLDPFNIMNPGKIFDIEEDPDV